jgi:uncharacterized protein YijF (DUF1287 family)
MPIRTILAINIILFLLNASVSAQDDFFMKLSDAAIELTKLQVVYDPQYYSIRYPGGDIPADRGVCTDVIIRAYRKLGIDLQKEVHIDMAATFDKYPKIWELKSTDTNIDHRRVPNLMTFFSRHGETKSISSDPKDYVPGDIVTWDLGGGIPHIGIVINRRSSDNKRFLVVHNIGNGQEISDCLFEYRVTGHYAYKKQVPGF